MAIELRFGQSESVQLEFPDSVEVTDFSAPRISPITNPEQAVRDALRQPLDFPPIEQAVFPGDRVVIAVAPDVPQAAAVIAGTLRSLLAAGIEPSDITLLFANSCNTAGKDGDDLERVGEEDFETLVPEDLKGAVVIAVHDPENVTARSYLAATKDAHPIYINRLLSDADLVIPIGAMRPKGWFGYLGLHNGLFPTFSDSETQRRFRICEETNWKEHQKRCRSEVAEVGWLLGLQMTIQIVPGPGDSILHIVAGNCEAVLQRGSELAAAAWRFAVPKRASLVVASIEGGPEQQTWENFARALHVASRAVDDDGAIVLCTNLSSPPGPVLRRMSDWSVGDKLPKQVRRERTADTLSATMLAEARQRSRVYLLSGLDEETVEELGIGCVRRGEEIERLGRNHESCLLLSNAQHAVVTIEPEELA